MTEQARQHEAGRALATSGFPRPPHLTLDLALAEHRRLEPGGHREEMADRRVVVQDGQMIGDILGREEPRFAEEVAYVLHRRVELLGRGVDLRAHARR